MENKKIELQISVYKQLHELEQEDQVLLQKAVNALPDAYAPYSGFRVAATVLLKNGEIITGTNQENAAYPVCICAEGTALSAASALYPDVPVLKLAVTVKSSQRVVSSPVAPCGVCRQRIAEYEQRFQQSIQVVMMGETGEVYKVDSIQQLLPLSFSKSDL